MERISVVDIAREAGVSRATVSRVVNGTATVAPETRARVEAVMARHEFELNASAASLRRGRSNAIGIAVASISQPWYVKLIRAMRTAVTERGFTTIVYDVQHDDNVLVEHTRSARSLKLAGMVLATGDRLDAPPVRAALDRLNESVPLVVVGQPLPGAHWPTLHFDDVGASATAALDLLRRRSAPILFIGENPRSFLGAERREGVGIALDAYPLLKARSRFLATGSDMSYAAGYRAAMSLRDELEQFGSVFCVNDELALGVCRAAAELGVSVPGDLLVMGYGDVDFLPYTIPSLSSLSGDADTVASHALEAIFARINGDPIFTDRTYTRRLIHRESTTPSE